MEKYIIGNTNVLHGICYIKLEYMNSSSSNQLLMILRNLDENCNINKLIINWFYEEDDDDALESGQIYEELLQKALFKYHVTI